MKKKKNMTDLVRDHNKEVEKQFKKAEKGETINLTDLMISKEKIIKKRIKGG